MCGIFSLLLEHPALNDNKLSQNRNYYLDISKKIRHRGPDWNGIYIDDDNNVLICHERLSIVGVDNGSQPIVSRDDNLVLSVNGEIYNYRGLLDTVLQNKYQLETKSDCEIIVYLYREFGMNFVKMLDGIFSFVLYDKQNKKYIIARDPIGIIPLYYGFTHDNNLMVASEMKCLIDDCAIIDNFPPGHVVEISIKEDNNLQEQFKNNLFQYYNPLWRQEPMSQELNEDLLCREINQGLTKSVDKRLMCDVPFGVLLSGGLDSSLIASITCRLMKQRDSKWGSKIHSFSIGLENSPDLKAAKKVADFLGTEHHEYVFTVQEGLDAIRDLIYHLETFDVTTIRASTPMFLMSRKIKSMGIKMVLSGEGADEVYGGYLYFHNAPNDVAFHEECIRRVNGLHNFDCLRANKSTMSWGLEARVPFLDKSFLELSVPIHSNMKCRARINNNNNNKKIEKYILRKAFDCPEEPYLPEEILWRQKEQFSDGVGYNWIDDLIEYTKEQISDQEFEELNIKYKTNDDVLDLTKEAVYYRKIFDELFPGRAGIVPRWIPQMDWEGVSHDPSGRAQQVHDSADSSLMT